MKPKMLGVLPASLAAWRSRWQLKRKSPKRHEKRWWARKRGRRVENSKAFGYWCTNCHTQSRNCNTHTHTHTEEGERERK